VDDYLEVRFNSFLLKNLLEAYVMTENPVFIDGLLYPLNSLLRRNKDDNTVKSTDSTSVVAPFPVELRECYASQVSEYGIQKPLTAKYH